MNRIEENNIEIPLNRKKLKLLLTGSIIFVVLGIWIVLSTQQLENYFGHSIKILIAGYAAIILFTLCAIYIMSKLHGKTPGLIVSKNFIIDNSSALAAGKIFWSDIRSISFIEINRQKIILIQVTNPKNYIDNQSNRFKRKLMKINFQMYGTPISITANSLKIPFEELLALLNQKLIQSKSITL